MLSDKYKIDNLRDIVYNKDIYKNIFNMKNDRDIVDVKKLKDKIDKIEDMREKVEILKLVNKTGYIDKEEYYNRYNDLPNLLVYGCENIGKKTFVKLLLEDIYMKDKIITSKKNYQITQYSNNVIEIEIEQSDNHIVIEPTNSALDKHIVHEIVREYAQTVSTNVNVPFKMIIINDIDKMTYYAQTSLRCIMEKYYKVCKFILITEKMSKIIEPLKSRALNIKLDNIKDEEKRNILKKVCILENMRMKKDDEERIIKISNNIVELYNNLDIYKYKLKNNCLWKDKIMEIMNIMIKFIEDIKEMKKNKINEIKFNYNQYITIMRNILYNIYITNINNDDIIIEMIKAFYNVKNENIIEPILLTILSNIFSVHIIDINKGKRTLIHIESLINNLLYHISKYYDI